MEKKEYLVGVKIIEGRHFKGKDYGGTSDPYVKITCATPQNLPPQKTITKYKTNSAVWNQSFTFPQLLLNQYELETLELIIEVKDHNHVKSDELIGLYSIGFSSMHRSLNHEFYRQWLQLFNPDFPNEVQGYLLISSFIVGPNERIPSHAQDEEIENEEEIDENILKGMSEEEKINYIQKKQGIYLLTEPNIVKKSYQLTVNILKAESLPQCSNESTNSFVSVRCVGCFLQTNTVEKNFNPLFNASLRFPVRYPILNEKIVVKIFSHGSYYGKTDSIFIANIPEFPSQNDAFNIMKLLSRDGKSRAQWFNLYGIKPKEKSKKFTKKEGSQYLGRVLISLHISPHEKPQLLATSSNPANEPPTANFRLWVDVYDLVNCTEANGNTLWIQTTVGHHKSEKHKGKYKEQSKSYTWGNKFSLKPMIVSYPMDLKQTPDIIINVYISKTFGGDQRIAYIRIPVTECQKREANPQWYRLKSPYSDKICPGIMLMNVQYIWEGADIQRYPKQRPVEAGYKFYAQILQGFELAPSYQAENLNTKVEIRIGNAQQKDRLITESALGRFPQWTSDPICKDIVLDKNLDFATDMRVLVYNKSTSAILGRESWDDDLIGEFSVPVASITKLYDKPQFFNIIGSEGELQGQLLARFYLKEIDKRKKKDNQHAIEQKFKDIAYTSYKVNLYVSVFGIRNLIKNAKKPMIKLKLTNREDEQVINTMQVSNSKNVNFNEIKIFKKIKLPYEPLLWPYLQITVQDEIGGGCETCFSTISLIDFADKILEQKDIEFSKVQLNRNQNKIQIVQKQIDPQKYFLQLQKSKNKDLQDQDAEPGMDQDSEEEKKKNYGLNPLLARSEGSDDDQNSQSNLSIDQKDIKLEMQKSDLLKKQKVSSEEQKLQKNTGKDLNKLDLEKGYYQDGIQIDYQNMIEIECTQKQKKKEEKRRLKQINELQERMDQLQIEMMRTKKKEKKEIKKVEIVAIKNVIDELEAERMNEQKFWGYVEDEDEEFQYGREILKEGTFESQLQLPYKEFPLFQNETSWGKVKTASVGGILRSGVLTGAKLKASIRIIESENDNLEDDEDQQSDEEALAQPQNLENKTPGEPEKDSEDEQSEQKEYQNNDEKDKALLLKIFKKYPYDLTQKEFLKYFNLGKERYKVRLFILRCQNLTAIDSHLDVRSQLAGLEAKCSADPFPVIRLGDGKNNMREQSVKEVDERDKEVKQNLNPNFNRVYEFDATFPDDWKLEIEIRDKGRIRWTDALIGATQIDLEDRLYGMLRKQCYDSLDIYKKQLQEKRKEMKLKKIPNFQEIKAIEAKIDDVVGDIAQVKQIEPKPVPVEFRELLHPKKLQPQGIIEMWVEVLSFEEARKIPPPKPPEQLKDEYEIRLIIWETRDVPLVNRDSVDIYLKVNFDPTGWSKNLIEKETDTHYASKDGKGEFNYRMKFNLETPCDFPRLTFSLYDHRVITDEAIGQSIMEMKNTVSKLMKEGRIDINYAWISFSHPNRRHEHRGDVLISMSIIPKFEADGAPVGEAQNEPNQNPRLEKPQTGRGASAYVSSRIVDVSKFQIPKVNMFRKLIIIGIIAGVVILVLVLLRFFI